MEGETVLMEISTLLTNVGTVMTTVFTVISDNPLLSTVVGIGLVGAGAGLFGKLKRSARW